MSLNNSKLYSQMQLCLDCYCKQPCYVSCSAGRLASMTKLTSKQLFYKYEIWMEKSSSWSLETWRKINFWGTFWLFFFFFWSTQQHLAHSRMFVSNCPWWPVWRARYPLKIHKSLKNLKSDLNLQRIQWKLSRLWIKCISKNQIYKVTYSLPLHFLGDAQHLATILE